MEIIRGSLEDISRPASSEQTGARLSSVSLPHNDRIYPTTPFSLVVLSNDDTGIQIQSHAEEAVMDLSATGHGKGYENDTDEEREDSKLQRAVEEMRRLDEILSEKICREKEVRRQRKELQARLWQEFQQSMPEGHAECAHEVLNTRLFLALESPTGTEEEAFLHVFETEVPECDHNRDSKLSEQSEKMPDIWTEPFKVGHEEAAEEQFEGSHCGASKGKTKQKDFVKRNIELVSGEGCQVFLTQTERERLNELLQGVDEEDEENAKGGDSEDLMWALSIPTGQGYTPEPSDLEQLNNIDSKIHLHLPVEEILSVQSSYTGLGRMSQAMKEAAGASFVSQYAKGHGSRVSWMCDEDQQPAEKVLQDIKERRGQERRLQEIQQQLELLGGGQQMTDESPGLTEEQLLSLLEECELTESWIQQDFEAL